MLDLVKNNWKKILISIGVIILFLLGFIYRGHISEALKLIDDPKAINEYIKSFGAFGAFIFMGLQIFQVVIFFVPGEVIQTAGGYIFGTFLGTLYSIIGINIGSVILFYISRKFGAVFVHKVVPEKVRKPFEKLLNSKRINLIVFLIYVLPGIPKDSSIFLCALSKVTFLDFMIYSTLGRMPALIISSFYGANLATGNRTSIIALTVAIVLGLGAFAASRKYVMDKLHKLS